MEKLPTKTPMKEKEYIEKLEECNRKLFDMVSSLQKTVKEYEDILKDFNNVFQGGEPKLS